jgi:hypothetical protein
MAKTARKESEEVSDVIKPDFEKAMNIIRRDIRPNEEEGATVRGNASGYWKAIDKDCHVNKAAAKLVMKLMGQTEEARDDFLRSMYGMMLAANIGISADLVDAAEGKAPDTMPVQELDGTIRQMTASDAEFYGAKPSGITGDALPPELTAAVEAGTTKTPSKVKPALIANNETVN